MAHEHIATGSDIVVIHGDDGYTVIPSPDNQLTRLHYFDGKLLRAHDLEVEQSHVRAMVALSNQGGGMGVIHGLDTTLVGGGASLCVGPGMAVDGQGRLLLLPGSIDIGVGELIARSAGLRETDEGGPPRPSGAFRDCPPRLEEPEPDTTPSVEGLYLITLAHAEALCGHEDVYGRLCEEACVTTTDRPYVLEGVVLRARRLELSSPLPSSGAVSLGTVHLRSRVASAYFADERLRVGSLISGAGLGSQTWCLGARLRDASEVPLAVVAREGGSTVFLDAWTARRERMDAPAKRYWAWRMAMRPWDVFLAMVLQFQCQLRGLLEGEGPGVPRDEDDCGEAVRGAYDVVARLAKYYSGVTEVLDRFRANSDLSGELEKLVFPGGRADIERVLGDLEASSRALSRRGGRRIIDGGIVELPPAGWLPVVPGATPVDRQVRALLGEGLDLRYCVVRPDFVPHAFEEAQHMDRISLLQGLDDPTNKPEVDILVPDGELVDSVTGTEGAGVRGTLKLAHEEVGKLLAKGLGRLESTATDGFELRWVGSGPAAAVPADSEDPAVEAIPDERLEGYVWVEREEFDPRIYEMVNEAADYARTYAESLPPTENPPAPFFYRRGGTPMPVVSPQPAAEIRLPTGGDSRRVGGVWMRGRIERNPFDLAFGESTPVLGQLVLGQAVDGGFLLDATVRGEFHLAERMRAVDVMEGVSGRLQGVVSGRIRQPGGELEEGNESFLLHAGLTVRRGDTGWTATLELGEARARDRGDKLVFTASWNGTPVRVEITGSLTSVALPIAEAIAHHDDDALRRSGEDRTLALRGLDLAAAVVEDTGFRRREEEWIFGARGGDTASVVRATRDWVLFHRRRTKVCARPEPRPEPRPRVRYRLLVASAAATNQPSLNTRSVRVFPEIGSAEFFGGTASLATNGDAIRADWRAASPGDLIVRAGIATHGDMDAPTVERARVRRLLDVLSSEADGSGATVAVMPDVPTEIDQAGYDGVIVFGARTRPAEETCHDVWWAPVDVIKMVLEPGGDAWLQRSGTRLGDVAFRVDDDQARDADDVLEAYGNLPERRVAGVLVLSREGDESAGTEALRAARGRAIADSLGLGAVNVVPQLVAWELPGDCPALTVVYGETRIVNAEIPRIGMVVVTDTGGGNVDPLPEDPDLTLPFDESGVRVHEGNALEALERLRETIGEAGANRVTVVRPAGVDDESWERRRSSIESTLRERGVLDENATVEVRDTLTTRERRALGDRGDEPLVLVRVPRRE